MRVVHDPSLENYVWKGDRHLVKLYSTVDSDYLKFNRSWSLSEIMKHYLLHEYRKAVRIDIRQCDVNAEVRDQQSEHVKELVAKMVGCPYCCT